MDTRIAAIDALEILDSRGNPTLKVPVEPVTVPSSAAVGHQPSCFGLEEEKGEHWKGGGAAKPAVNEARPSL
jgi:enolase